MRASIFNIKRLLMSFAIIFAVASPSFAHEGHMAAKATMKESPKVVELRQTLRDLWIDHIFWTRNVVFMTRMGDTQAAKVAEESAVKNARAIADAMAPLYGKPAADKLFNLLAGHYGAVKQYMEASFAGNAAGKNAAAEKLGGNAKEIAAFLSSANPNWPKEVLVSLLTAHGGHHMAQIDQIAMKDYAAEAGTWEAMKSHMYMIADALASGIAKQFPKKF